MSILTALKEQSHSIFLNYWPKLLVNHWWRQKFGYTIDWENPRDINEKIWWLLIYSDTTEWSRLSDKYNVREYIKDMGLEHILIPLLGVWDDANEIDYDHLPNKFVLKCNHDSGSVVIIDKNKGFIKDDINSFLNGRLNHIYGLNGEFYYTKIRPRIVAEEYLDVDNKQLTNSQIDYKIWCFDGTPFCIMTCHNRTDTTLCLNLYDLKWQQINSNLVPSNHFLVGDGNLPKPEKLDDMLMYASRLSKGFPEVRVDFYNVKGKVFFGEMTFSSMRGMINYYSPAFLKVLGDHCNLSIAQKR